MRAASVLVASVLASALALALAPAHASIVASDVTLTVEGEPARGLLAVPASCVGVVVIAHGYGHNATSHKSHLEHLADLGFVAIAMDYRGPQSGFPLANGAADTVAATHHAKSLCPGAPAYFYSVSMGTAVAALALPQLPNEFVYWVNNEGLSMLAETWAEATAVCPGVPFGCTAAAGIEADTGGTPATAPEAYVARSAALRVGEIEGLHGVVMTHGLNDGLVPYDQGRSMSLALRAHGIPTDFYTALRGAPGGEGTSITGYGGFNVDGLAGHGTESNDTHTLTKLSFDLLDAVITGAYGPTADRETVVDREFGALP